MKEKQGNNPNSYGKLMKRMLIYLGIGGVCGFFVGIFMTFGVKNGMSNLSDLVRPLALPIIAVILRRNGRYRPFSFFVRYLCDRLRSHGETAG